MVGVFNAIINLLMVVLVTAGVAYLVNQGTKGRGPRLVVAVISGVLAGALTLWGVMAIEKLENTARGVIVSILVSGLLFIGANKLFDLAPSRWAYFSSLTMGGVSLLVFSMLWGNRAIDRPAVRTLIAVIVGIATGYLLGTVKDRWARLAVGVGGGALLGIVAASGMRAVVLQFQTFDLWPVLPDLNYPTLIILTLVGAAVGVLFWLFRGRQRSPYPSIVGWATAGFFLGAWVTPALGLGQKWEAYLAAVGVGIGFGLTLALKPVPDLNARSRIETSSRSFIFVGPALIFIIAALVYPTLRTLFLSFYNTTGTEAVGFENYYSIFTNSNIFNVSNWVDIFSSRLFWGGVVLAVFGLGVAILLGRQGGYKVRFTPGAGMATSIGLLLVAMAALAALRGTIFNNIWWVLTVTLVASSAGLAIAVLADRAKYESLAKSLIFMPMAISFVGAGVIWRFMYLARDPSRPQTGVLNTLWVGFGRLSNNPMARNIAVAVLLVLAGLLLWLALRSWRANERTIAVGSAISSLPLFWLITALVRGVGGIAETPNGQMADTIFFVQETPFNNLWLMLVLIWIQTGFTMVIFSAAIKAVPAELIEASKVDGATESQTFWRVVIPQIAPTIGVVVTTLIVLIMKVFDIVKVMTNGNFDTQVIANEMWQRAFTELNFGLGSALAVVLFVAVLPILYLNIRRMQRAAA